MLYNSVINDNHSPPPPSGNYSFMTGGVPMLHDVMFEMAKLVPNPDPLEVSEGRTNIYDTWLARYPGEPVLRGSDNGDSQPSVATLGSGSDFQAFMFNLGIPSMDMAFTAVPVRWES